MSIKLTPLKSGGWHRLGLLAALAFGPVTVMLWSTGAFGDGSMALGYAVVFYGAALTLCLLLGFGAAWVVKGFAVKAHADDEADDHGHDRPRRPAPHAAHPPAAAGHAPAHGATPAAAKAAAAHPPGH